MGHRLAYILSHHGSCSKEQKLLIPLASFSRGSQGSCVKTLSSCSGSCPRRLSHCCELCGSEKRNCSTGKDRRVAWISLLRAECIAAAPQGQLCHLTATEVHPPQPLQPGHAHQWLPSDLFSPENVMSVSFYSTWQWLLQCVPNFTLGSIVCIIL